MKTFYFCAWFFSLLTILYATELPKSECLEREKALAILETAEDLLSKAKDSFPSCKEDINSTDESECGGKKPLAYIEISKKLISDVRENFPNCHKVEKIVDENIVDEEIVDEKIVKQDSARDCSEILASGRNQSGVYTIWPSESNTTAKPLQVYCDMKTDNGGWTMIQRRGKYPVQQNFFQDFESYSKGFGNITEEFWLGNENIRVLCHKGCKIRFDLQAENGVKVFAVYRNFHLSRGFIITISDYTGNAGDGMQAHNNYPFSTKDSGNTSKAKQRQGGWWYSNDTQCNLNGVYQPNKSEITGVYWQQFIKFQNLGRVEIKVRPK